MVLGEHFLPLGFFSRSGSMRNRLQHSVCRRPGKWVLLELPLGVGRWGKQDWAEWAGMTLQLSDGGMQGRGPSGRVLVTPSRPVIGCIKGCVFSKKVLLLEDKSQREIWLMLVGHQYSQLLMDEVSPGGESGWCSRHPSNPGGPKTRPWGFRHPLLPLLTCSHL